MTQRAARIAANNCPPNAAAQLISPCEVLRHVILFILNKETHNEMPYTISCNGILHCSALFWNLSSLFIVQFWGQKQIYCTCRVYIHNTIYLLYVVVVVLFYVSGVYIDTCTCKIQLSCCITLSFFLKLPGTNFVLLRLSPFFFNHLHTLCLM